MDHSLDSQQSSLNDPGLRSFNPMEEDEISAAPPGECVKFLLSHDDETDVDQETHDVFCEMDELKTDDDGDMTWKETARWIKFEEDVDEGGDRWSKPFVASLTLISLFELRRGLLTASLMLNVDATSLTQIVEILVGDMATNNALTMSEKESVVDLLLTHHHHQHQNDKKPLPFVRSLVDIGRKLSEMRLEGKDQIKKSGSVTQSSAANNPGFSAQSIHDIPSEAQFKFNEHYARKIPHGAEAANILVGEVNFLNKPILGFVRLSKSILLGELTEVPVPTRFLFVLLGPKSADMNYREMGRSIGTLMSDKIFHDVAYKARHREDILAGIDEFLDHVTVLPPGEWDPSTRIEPPKNIPSQESRRNPIPIVSPDMAGKHDDRSSELMRAKPLDDEQPKATLQRTGRLFGGLINDIKRKLPWYLSDYRDGLAFQCLASFGFIYFACLAPIITFGGLLGIATENHLAAMESLVSAAICGISYHLFSGQPLTIIGSTGPVLVFETIVYSFCKEHGLDYLALRFWIGTWMSLILFLIVMLDLSVLVKFITRFTEESFALLIGLIYVVEAFEKLFHILKHNQVDTLGNVKKYCYCQPGNITRGNDTAGYNGSVDTTESYIMLPEVTDAALNLSTPSWQTITDRDLCHAAGGELTGNSCDVVPDVFLFSCMLLLGTFVLSMGMKMFRNGRIFPSAVRALISDFSVFTAILLMVAIDYVTGLATPKLLVPDVFRPTRTDRGWIVDPFSNPLYTIPAAILPALLATILIFMDQQITAVIVNRKENKLKKGCGYHLDMLCIAVQISLCSLFGTPWFVAATVLSINHVHSLSRVSETSAPGERPVFLGVRENRLTGLLVFILIGLSALLAKILAFIPMPVLYGVFLFMGVASLKNVQMVQRILLLFMPPKHQPDYMYLRHVRLHRVHLFTVIQVVCMVLLWIVKYTKNISIIFPLMVLAMCFARKTLDWVFTQHELSWLDDVMPDTRRSQKKEEQEQNESLVEMADDLSLQTDKKSIQTSPQTQHSTSPRNDQCTLSPRKSSQLSGDESGIAVVTFNIGEESANERTDIRLDKSHGHNDVEST